jgi:hypothetical protein
MTGSPSMDAKGQAGKLNLSEGVPRNVTVIAARWAWVYEDGKEAGPTDDVYLHHLISSDVTKLKANPFSGCNGFDEMIGRQFNNRGQDSGEKETLYMMPNSTLVSGYQLGVLPILRVQYDLINYSKQPKNVYLQLTMEYLRGHRGLDTGTVLESVGGTFSLLCPTRRPLTPPGCENDVPLNVNGTTTGRVIKISEDATIVWACGHMHPGGAQVRMEINGKLACGSQAIYDERHDLASMTLCPVPIEIKQGDNMVLTSTYDTKAHPMRKSTEEGGGHDAHLVGGGHDVMGMMGLVYTVKGRG